MNVYEREMKLIEIDIIANGEERRIGAIKRNLEKIANGEEVQGFEAEELLRIAIFGLTKTMEELRQIESLIKLVKE